MAKSGGSLDLMINQPTKKAATMVARTLKAAVYV